MRVSEIMSKEPVSVRADGTIQAAAAGMEEFDVGALPVVNDTDELVGMVTDRDIALRGVGKGHDPETPVGEVMTGELFFANASDELDDVLSYMGERQVRRIPVIEDGRLVGIVAQADIAAVAKSSQAAEALRSVSEPAATDAEMREKTPD